MRAIGLMSGTSGDGIDAVMIELDDPAERRVPTLLAHAYMPFEPALQRELCHPEELGLARVAELHFELAHRYADAVRELPAWSTAACVGMHGQTVWHVPPSQSRGRGQRSHTLQLGSTGVLAAELALPVVGDLRAADVARGGEGAPIMPLCHWFFSPPEQGPRLVVNVGGIANYTYVADALERVTASDVGPGMMLTDALARHVSGDRLAYDRDGELSRGGHAIAAIVDRVLAQPFFARPSPRSTGREEFGPRLVAELLAEFGAAPGADLLTSSLEITARAIVGAAQGLPPVHGIVLTGGGARHPGLRARLAELASPVPVEVASDGVLAPNHHEAAGMALIAARTLARLPSALPQVTGAREASILGHIHWP